MEFNHRTLKEFNILIDLHKNVVLKEEFIDDTTKIIKS